MLTVGLATDIETAIHLSLHFDCTGRTVNQARPAITETPTAQSPSHTTLIAHCL